MARQIREHEQLLVGVCTAVEDDLGSQRHGLPGRDYVAVAELLLAAGARLEPRFTDVAEGPLAGWLQERA